MIYCFIHYYVVSIFSLRFPTEVVTPIRNLFCKLLDAAISDARRGRTSLVQKIEEFADTLVTNATCPPVANYDM